MGTTPPHPQPRYDLPLRGWMMVPALIGVALLMLAALLYPAHVHDLRDALAARQATEKAGLVARGLDLDDSAEVTSRLRVLEGDPAARFAVARRSDGTPVASWSSAGQDAGDAGADRSSVLVVHVPVPGADLPAQGDLELGFDTAYADGLIDGHLRLVLVSALLAAIGSLVASWCFGTALARPLRQITDTLGDADAAALVRAAEALELDRTYVSDERMRLRRAVADLAARVAAEVDRAEQERTRAVVAHADAVQASEAKSRFLAAMSHELRTPLTTVLGYAELILTERCDEARIEHTQRIQSAGQHLLTLINDLLDLSRIEARRMLIQSDPIDLHPFLSDIGAALQPLIRRGNNRLEIARPPHLDMVVGDALRLRQCLLNLLTNAAKFTTDGLVELRVSRHGPAVAFAVHDTGIGMTEEQIGSLFQDFGHVALSEHHDHVGAGLGLALTRRLAQMMGGDVTVQSAVGEGSTFTLTVSDRSAARSTNLPPERMHYSEPPTPNPATAAGGVVLLVEDDDHLRSLGSRLLTRAGFLVHVAANGPEAEQLASEHDLDLLVSDVELPGIDGPTLAARLTRVQPDLQVLFVSGSEPDPRAHADFLQKPYSRAELIKRVQARIEASRSGAPPRPWTTPRPVVARNTADPVR